MNKRTAGSGGSLSRWEEWIDDWLSPAGLDLTETGSDEVVWRVTFPDGSGGEIRIKPAALHSDSATFRRITDKLSSMHWTEVVRERGAIRIHDNAWIEKVE